MSMMVNESMAQRIGIDPRKFDLGPELSDQHGQEFLKRVLRRYADGKGVAVEFGVGAGNSTRLLAEKFETVLGFDSFEGLPEDWREGYPAGSFTQQGVPPVDLRDNPKVYLETDKWETCPPINLYLLGSSMGPVKFVHIDCDLFTSTIEALRIVWPVLEPGVIVVFDEIHGYEGYEDHELLALVATFLSHIVAVRTGDASFLARGGRELKWEVLGHGKQQWAIRITQ